MPPSLTDAPITEPDVTDRSTYRSVTERQFALMMKDPDPHLWERIIIIGTVTQFDPLTGPTEFRADVRAQPGSEPVNALVSASYRSSILDNVVKGDSLTMFVKLGPLKAYRTELGTRVVVPSFTVYSLMPYSLDTWPGN